MQNKETVYIAGKISGDPNYREKFKAAADKLTAAGYVVLSPAILPPVGFSYEAYIRMSVAMMDECEAVCFLPDWRESAGAMNEYSLAIAKGTRVFFFEDWEEAQADEA